MHGNSSIMKQKTKRRNVAIQCAVNEDGGNGPFSQVCHRERERDATTRRKCNIAQYSYNDHSFVGGGGGARSLARIFVIKCIINCMKGFDKMLAFSYNFST